MTGRRIVAIVVAIVLLAGIVDIIAHGSTATSNTNGVQVIAAENFWGNIAQQLGGNSVHVTSIITDPNADPHLYESSAGDASDVTSANVVIVNGVGYDDFMSKLLGAANKPNRHIITAQQIMGATEGSNQHLWYDIPKVSKVAAQITDAYIAKDPIHKSAYEHNLTTFDQSLTPLLTMLNQIKQQYGGEPVAYTEPVPGYALATAGLDIKTPQGFAKSIEDGDDPSPADTSAMDALMTNNSVKVLVYNAQTVSPVTEHVKALAQEAGIPIIGVTETMPANQKTYQSWMSNEFHELQTALAENK